MLELPSRIVYAGVFVFETAKRTGQLSHCSRANAVLASSCDNLPCRSHHVAEMASKCVLLSRFWPDGKIGKIATCVFWLDAPDRSNVEQTDARKKPGVPHLGTVESPA